MNPASKGCATVTSKLRLFALALLGASLAAPALAQSTDLSGFWWVHNPSGQIAIDPATLPMLPAARKAYIANQTAAAARTPMPVGVHACMPDGPTRLMLQPYPFQILQRPAQVTILFERQHMVRFLRIGGAHEPDYYPLYVGDSIAHWDGPALVVETEGMNDLTVLDDRGLPHGDQLKLVERFTLAEGGKTLVVDTLVTDPGSYAKPWSYNTRFDRKTNVALMDDVCTYGPPQRDAKPSETAK